MTAPDDLDRQSELMEIGGSLRSFGSAEERTARETRISFSRRQRGERVQTPPGPIRQAVERVEHSRRVLIAGAGVALLAAAVAATGFVVNRPSPAATAAPALVGTAGLTQNQAACAAYATIEAEVAQSMIERYNVGLPPDPRVYEVSVRRLDALSHTYPSADYRLIIAFGGVADQAVTLLHGAPNSDQHGTVPGYTTLAVARQACLEIAGYDTASATALSAGHPPPSAAARGAYNAFDAENGDIPNTPGLADNPGLPSAGRDPNASPGGSSPRAASGPSAGPIDTSSHWRPAQNPLTAP